VSSFGEDSLLPVRSTNDCLLRGHAESNVARSYLHPSNRRVIDMDGDIPLSSPCLSRISRSMVFLVERLRLDRRIR